MGKATNKKPTPPVGDIGPETEAAMAGCTVEVTETEGRTPVRKKFRDHLLEHMTKPRQYKGGARPALISRRQGDAGLKLHEAWCETNRSPSQTGIYVDSTPDWGGIILGNIERIWRFSDVSVFIPRHTRNIVLQVCLQQIPINAPGREYYRQLEALKEGLDAIADGLRI